MAMHPGDEARGAPPRAAKLVEVGDMNDPPSLLEVPLQPSGGPAHDDVSSNLDDIQGKSAGVFVRDPQKTPR